MRIQSDLYKRSRNGKYRQYFSQGEDVKEHYSSYEIGKRKCFPPKVDNKWNQGISGIPVYWDTTTGTVYTDCSDNHTLVVGPTGSKKSRLVVMPQVLMLGSARESIIVSDPKAEIYQRTADYLEKQGYNIFVLNFRDPNMGDAWNPLAIPYSYYLAGEVDRAYEFVNDIAANLTHTAESKSDPFWDNSAGTFFFGLTILLFKYCKEKKLDDSFVTIANVIAFRDELLGQTSSEARRNPQALWDFAKKDPIISSNLVGIVEAATETRASIVSVFDQKVRMFSIQPNLLNLLSNNTIQIDLLGESPTAVFLILPDEKTGYHGLASLFIKQSYEYLIHLAQIKTNRKDKIIGLENRLNYIIDEFASLPTIYDFPAMITAARSRNIRFTLIIQNKNQLIQRYNEEASTIMSNCMNWIVLSCREQIFLEEISFLCGKTNGMNALPLVPPESVQRLSKEAGEALVLLGRMKPMITRLADIDIYDHGEYQYRSLLKRKQKKGKRIDLRRFVAAFEKEQKQKRENQIKLIEEFRLQNRGKDSIIQRLMEEEREKSRLHIESFINEKPQNKEVVETIDGEDE